MVALRLLRRGVGLLDMVVVMGVVVVVVVGVACDCGCVYKYTEVSVERDLIKT